MKVKVRTVELSTREVECLKVYRWQGVTVFTHREKGIIRLSEFTTGQAWARFEQEPTAAEVLFLIKENFFSLQKVVEDEIKLHGGPINVAAAEIEELSDVV